MVPRPGRGDLDDLDGRIRQQPDQAEGYFKRGRFHAQRAMTGQHAALDAAMADFSRALERDPSHTRGPVLARLCEGVEGGSGCGDSPIFPA